MRADEVFPAGRVFSFGGRRDPMATQDVAHRLVRYPLAKIGQGSHDAVIAPGGILLRHLHHQTLCLLIDSGPSGGTTESGPVELVGDQLAIPTQNGIRHGRGRYFLQTCGSVTCPPMLSLITTRPLEVVATSPSTVETETTTPKV